MKLVASEGTAAPVEYDSRQLFSDLFHQLSQPATSLCCSLELALLQTRTVEQYAEIVNRTLGEARKVSWLAMAMRELFDAGQAGDGGEILELRGVVEHAVSDLLPVAESAGVQICYSPRSACTVWFNVTRLRQALFHLLGFALASGRPGAAVKIELDERGQEAVLGLTVPVPKDGDGASSTGSDGEYPPRDLARRLGLGIARAIFDAAGGSVSVQRRVDTLSVEVRILRGRTPWPAAQAAP